MQNNYKLVMKEICNILGVGEPSGVSEEMLQRFAYCVTAANYIMTAELFEKYKAQGYEGASIDSLIAAFRKSYEFHVDAMKNGRDESNDQKITSQAEPLTLTSITTQPSKYED